MVEPADEEYILRHAKVPEHVPALMAGIARADVFLTGPFVCLAKGDGLIFIGYPLEGEFSDDAFSSALDKAMARIRPSRTWFIAPDIPASLVQRLTSREDDFYYRLDLQSPDISPRMVRIAGKAAQMLTVDASRLFSDDHVRLTDAFLQRQKLPPRVHQLYLCMKDYLLFSETSLLLSARDLRGRLSAYYILESGAREFLAYIVGCHSEENPVSHASDLLFYEMVQTARRLRKGYIHLGLGVNEGIARFKKKWGGFPFLRYAFGEIGPPAEWKFRSWMEALASHL